MTYSLFQDGVGAWNIRFSTQYHAWMGILDNVELIVHIWFLLLQLMEYLLLFL